MLHHSVLFLDILRGVGGGGGGGEYTAPEKSCRPPVSLALDNIVK